MVEKTKNPINDFVCKTTFHLNTIKGFHTNFQCSKKGQTLVEQFNLKQLFTK